MTEEVQLADKLSNSSSSNKQLLQVIKERKLPKGQSLSIKERFVKTWWIRLKIQVISIHVITLTL